MWQFYDPDKDSWRLPPSLGLITDTPLSKNYKHETKSVKTELITFNLLYAWVTKQICVWAEALPLNSCRADQNKPVCGHLFAELFDCQSLMWNQLLK